MKRRENANIALSPWRALRQRSGLQQPEGFWLYPLPERKHLIATVEGNWGAIGLLATYAREPRKEFLQAAVRWYDYLVGTIGFQAHTPGEAINYFDKPRGKIPNNSVEAVWLFLRLWKATGDARFLEHVDAMLDFLVKRTASHRGVALYCRRPV